MRLFLRLFILFAAAIGLAVMARFNPGNVVFFYPPYRIDLSLNLFLLVVVGLFLVLHVLLNAIRRTREIPLRVAAYRKQKREHEGNRALRDALKALFEGRFGQAEKAARRAAQGADNAGLSALIGAWAAHRLAQPERRDIWLMTIKDEPSLKTARLMTSIELFVDEDRPELALEAVQELNASGIRHLHALRLALKAHQRSGHWPEVLRLVRLLDKHRALHPALSQRLRELAYADLLSSAAHDAESIRRVWATIPATDRIAPFVAARAAQVFHACGLDDDACAVVEKALVEGWDDRLVRAYRDYGAAPTSPRLLTQIEHCEQWIHQHPADSELALTLGTLCLKQKLWGQAQRYLEQALSDATQAHMVREVHLKLAHLHDALGHAEQAAMHYKQCAVATIL